MSMPKNAEELADRFRVVISLDRFGKRTQYVGSKDPKEIENENVWFSSFVVKQLLKEHQDDIIQRYKQLVKQNQEQI